MQTVSVQRWSDAGPTGNDSTMPRAQHRAAKGSTVQLDETLFPIWLLLIHVCTYIDTTVQFA